MAKFKTGVSGNPGGRPKVLAELQEIAREHAPSAVAELARLASKAKNETARIAAIRELLDRGYGKARQSVEIQTPQQGQNVMQELMDEIDARQREADRTRPQFHTPRTMPMP